MHASSNREWTDRIRELGREFETRAEEHDRTASFVSENYAALGRCRFFSAGVPVELGGGGVPHSAMCDLVRELAQSCGSTALAVRCTSTWWPRVFGGTVAGSAARSC